MAMAAAGYPSVDEVAVTVVVLVGLVLLFAGAVSAWAAGRPTAETSARPARPVGCPGFDANCRHDKSSAECPERQGGVCDE